MTSADIEQEKARMREFALRKYTDTDLTDEEKVLLEVYEHSFAPEPDTTAVFDAECEDVAVCPDPATARLVAKLLSEWYEKHWRL